jgi:hypothetical protein
MLDPDVLPLSEGELARERELSDLRESDLPENNLPENYGILPL